jgi:hypothetical protein
MKRSNMTTDQSGRQSNLIRRCESIHATQGWRCGLIAGHHGKHTALIPTGYPWDVYCPSHPKAIKDENGCRSCQLGWPAYDGGLAGVARSFEEAERIIANVTSEGPPPSLPESNQERNGGSLH